MLRAYRRNLGPNVIEYARRGEHEDGARWFSREYLAGKLTRDWMPCTPPSIETIRSCRDIERPETLGVPE